MCLAAAAHCRATALELGLAGICPVCSQEDAALHAQVKRIRQAGMVRSFVRIHILVNTCPCVRRSSRTRVHALDNAECHAVVSATSSSGGGVARTQDCRTWGVGAFGPKGEANLRRAAASGAQGTTVDWPRRARAMLQSGRM